ncbi:MAG TPA: putative Ig domain-containing protein [Myxococcota bacterium]|nr:putative Ig domain-containing protein [Myxococcota bacterium]
MSKRVIAIAIALACAACGGSDPTPPASSAQPAASAKPAGNSEPEIVSATLSPEPAGAGDSVSIDVNARDIDRDRLQTTIEWYRNGELDASLQGVSIPGNTFNRGDRVYAVAHVSDGLHEVSKATNPLTIGNAVPKVRGVSIGPSSATASDVLEAQATAQDADGDSIELSYRWFKNGQPLEGATDARLPAGRVRRGDKLAVEVSASDGTDQSEWVRSQDFVIANAQPVITSQPGYEMGPTGVYSYEISAKDADGDTPLRYELVSGPTGMAIDDATGAVTWTVPQDAKASNPIEVAVTDGFGGRATQRWVLSVDWNQAPAAPAGENGEDKAPANAKRAAANGEKPAAAAKSSDSKKPQAAKPQRAQPQRGDGDDLDRDQGEEYRQEKEEEF